MKRDSRRGAVLIEAVLLVLCLATAALFHREVLRQWNETLDRLQQRRLPYDGETLGSG